MIEKNEKFGHIIDIVNHCIENNDTLKESVYKFNTFVAEMRIMHVPIGTGKDGKQIISRQGQPVMSISAMVYSPNLEKTTITIPIGGASSTPATLLMQITSSMISIANKKPISVNALKEAYETIISDEYPVQEFFKTSQEDMIRKGIDTGKIDVEKIRDRFTKDLKHTFIVERFNFETDTDYIDAVFDTAFKYESKAKPDTVSDLAKKILMK